MVRLVGFEPTRTMAQHSRCCEASNYSTVAYKLARCPYLSVFDGFEPSGDAFDVLLFILLGIAVETGISKMVELNGIEPFFCDGLRK